MRSSDPDERLRGVQQAAAAHTPEALALLLRAAASTGTGSLDPRLPMEGVARSDPRALLAAVRGLATWSDRDSARTALAAIVAAPTVSFAARAAQATADPVDEDAVGAARIALARRQAAIALADSGSSPAIEALVATARAGGPGQQAAIDALAIRPPSGPAALGGVVLTTPAMVALAADIGDLRTLDAIVAALRSSDPGLRAAALTALGASGDMRVLDAARAAVTDADAHVRVAAADALVRLNAPEAPAAVEALVADDATALDGLRLAEGAPGEGVTRAAAARAMANADSTLRVAALRTLGRQTSPQAIQVLASLVGDPWVGGDAACAIARSPSAAAMSAIEELAKAQATRRLAARAYFVRRFTRGERSARLDALSRSLRTSDDARDRALGMQMAIALGEAAMSEGLADRDARVRRGAAMAVLAAPNDARAALLARLPLERDAATRVVLAAGLSDGDPGADVPLSALSERIDGGAPDAPIAAMALAARASEVPPATLERVLASRNPVVRAHAMRGLGRSAAPEAVGRLAAAYAWEADAEVRRAIVAALAARDDVAVPGLARRTLELARRLDPDAMARWTAERALAGRGFESAASSGTGREMLWIRLVPAAGAPPVADETAQNRARRGPRASGGVRRRRLRARPRCRRWRRAPAACAEASAVLWFGAMTQRPTPPEAVAPTDAPPFEAAIKRLSEIVQTLERGDLPLEESLRLFEEGVKLSRVSQGRLDAAEKRVEQLLAVDDRGQPKTTAFATDAADE